MEMREFEGRESTPSKMSDTSSLFPSFVSDVLHLYYKDDDAVEEDEEIQAFVKDVHNFGMQDFESCGERSANRCQYTAQLLFLCTRCLGRVEICPNENLYYLLLALQNSILLPGPKETGKTEILQ